MLLKLFIVFTYLSIFASAISRNSIFFSLLTSFVAISLGLLFLYNSEKKINYPTNFLPMLIFTSLLHLYIYVVSDRLQPFFYSLIFTEGIIYWLIFYNLENGSKLLSNLITSTILIYSSMYLLSNVFNLNITKLGELIFTREIPKHYFLGFMASLSLVNLAGVGVGERDYKKWMLFGISLFCLVISSNRSADIALIFGLLYLMSKQVKTTFIKKLVPPLLVALASIVFVFSSMSKTTIFERPYFLQSLTAVTSFPFGVGLGNFNLIGEHLLNTSTGRLFLSTYTHNIYLETLSGVGVFSVIFLYFLIFLFISILKSRSREVVWGALLITILINFMFDSSYSVPGFVWLFFISIGVFHARSELSGGN